MHDDHIRTDVGWREGLGLSLLLVIPLAIGFIAGRLTAAHAVGATTDTVTTIETAQRAYYAKTGKYFSILEYQTSTGERGYEMTYEDMGARYQKGYGPEAASRTFSTPLIPSATTTP